MTSSPRTFCPIRAGSRAHLVLALSVAGVLGLSGCGGVRGDAAQPDVGAVAAVASGSSPTLLPSPTQTPTATRSGADSAKAEEQKVPVPSVAGSTNVVPAALRPVKISVPSIGVESTLMTLGVNADGTIEVPSDPAQAGWLKYSPAPGQQGPAIIAGHVDSKTGPAVFYHLKQLKVGDPIVVTRANGTAARFTVDAVTTYLKSQFPTQETYGPVPGPALRLITCGGSYLRGEGGYQSNVVVFAS